MKITINRQAIMLFFGDMDLARIASEEDMIGSRAYLIESTPQRGREHYTLQLETPHTNYLKEREYGDLGTTDNRHRYAHGVMEITSADTRTIVLESSDDEPEMSPALAKRRQERIDAAASELAEWNAQFTQGE